LVGARNDGEVLYRGLLPIVHTKKSVKDVFRNVSTVGNVRESRERTLCAGFLESVIKNDIDTNVEERRAI